MKKRKKLNSELIKIIKRWGTFVLLLEIIMIVSVSWELYNLSLSESLCQLRYCYNQDQNAGFLTPNGFAEFLSFSRDIPRINPQDLKDLIPKIGESIDLSVPILMYHHIRDYNNRRNRLGTNLSVSPQKLDEQLKILKERGYQTVSLSSFIKERFNPAYWRFIAKPIILTFDDGYVDNYENGFSLLKKYGFSATFFIITQENGTNPAYINLDQIREMKEAGMELGSHTLSHPDLKTLSGDDLNHQLSASKQDMEIFCYPGGGYDEEVLSEVEKAGYIGAVTTKHGIANKNSDVFELPRIRIVNETNFAAIFP